jgi:hypothetical protein
MSENTRMVSAETVPGIRGGGMKEGSGGGNSSMIFDTL